MQELQDIKEKIFFETKNLLESLSEISSIEELLEKQSLFTDVSDRIAFFKILDKNKSNFEGLFSKKNNEDANADSKVDRIPNDYLTFNDPLYKNVIEENLAVNNEVLKDHHQADFIESGISNNADETIINLEIENTDKNEIELDVAFKHENLEFNHQDISAEKEKDFVENNDQINQHLSADVERDSLENNTESIDSPRLLEEKRFRLANIKGLKVQSLFQDEELELENNPILDKIDSGTILKSNVNIDFMEAEKKKTEFRLDLNDKVAFSKSLFAGNETELKSTIEKLNSFTNLEDAKQYLSEIYYEKNWTKVDEYAQRLWNLVENKFM